MTIDISGNQVFAQFEGTAQPAGFTIKIEGLAPTGVAPGTIADQGSMNGVNAVYAPTYDASTKTLTYNWFFMGFQPGTKVDQTVFYDNLLEDAPNAADDVFNAKAGVLLTGKSVLTNDTDLDNGGPLGVVDVQTITAINGAAAGIGQWVDLAGGGRALLNANGTLQFSDDGDFADLRAGQTRTTSFQYTVTDSAGLSDTATTTFIVEGVNDAPAAIRLTQIKSALEDSGVVALDDIVVTDADTGDIITATLTLNQPQAGALSTGTFGGATSVYSAATGVWTVTGSVAEVNAALAAVTFTPAPNWDQSVSIATQIRDAAGAGPANGTITVNISAVNDAPTALNLTGSKTFVEDPGTSIALDDIVIADPDIGDTVRATLTLSDPAAGLLTVGTYGSATATYDPMTGVWTVAGSVADVNAALAAVSFTPSANWDKTVTISTQIRDSANTGPANGLITLNAVPVNDAPNASNDTLASIAEDSTPIVIDFATLLANDTPGPLETDQTLTITTVSDAIGGTIQIVGTTIVFTPSPNYYGPASFKYTVQDNGTTNGQLDPKTATGNVSFAVTAIADTPTVASITTSEDTQSNFIVIARNAADGAEVTHFKITGITAGVLYLGDGTTPIADGAFITYAEAQAGLKFTPFPNFNGQGTFQVQASTSASDAGLGGARAMATINVASVSDAPTSADGSVFLLEDGQYTFKAADFAFADPSDLPQNSFLSIVIETLPNQGVLTFDGVVVATGTEVSIADIGKLVFTPGLNGAGLHYSSFTFRVKDDGGIDNGGRDTSVPQTMHIGVTAVNDAPSASDRSAVLAEDTAYTFQSTQFGFSDVLDPADALKAIIITGLPTAGLLTLDGIGVTRDQVIEAADIGKLVFTPAADAFGLGYATFTFKVQDNGGTANGGKDISEVEYSFRLDVTAVNDQPSGISDGPVVLMEGGSASATAIDGVLANDSDIDQDGLQVVGISHNNTVGSVGSAIAGDWGTLTLNADGSYTYLADPATQTMRVGDAVTDVFEYTVSDGNGGTATASITFRIDGENDAAEFSGTDVGSVTEDGSLTAVGVLTVSDTDYGEAGFQALADVVGVYGTFSFDDLTGRWTYVLDNGSRSVQALGDGEVKYDSFSVKSTDGTQHAVTIAVTGTKDADVIDGLDVDRTDIVNGDGTISQVTTIPVVPSGRVDTDGTAGLADIPLVTSGGQTVLLAQLPVGYGLQVSGPAAPKTAGTSLSDLIREIQAHTPAGSPDQGQLAGGGAGFLGLLPGDRPLIVQTITPTMLPGSLSAPGQPLLISGTPAAPGLPQTALVIDTSGLPPGTHLQLDNVDFAAVIGAVTITGGAGAQVVFGDSANQHIVLGADDDTLHGGGGDDYIGSHGGNDWLYGDAGNDTVSGGEGNDWLFGGSGHDWLYGGTGHDRLEGGAGNDHLLGESGNDTLLGGEGNDRLAGGLGRDTMWGGAGKDVFVFSAVKDSKVGSQRDVIADFQSGRDRIDLRDIDANTLRKGNQKFVWAGADGPFLLAQESAHVLKAGFTGKAGELRFDRGILMGDVNGDGRADFEIKIVGKFAFGDVIL
ncbi:Ig-like domain-containing protein [Microvirga lotononidis]|nr:Ig-like domain-containing protein [Microvirga lotononidis]WQO27558.1 Ig-like domain-containing protein [Microvirga lotononidis]